ncbi:MAG: 5'/3'-nucleotidase SurE [Sphaerochaetaceae bacterium]
MAILLVNDDGYTSEGINTLEQELIAHGYEVWVCAPSGERSATSHHITLGEGVKVTSFGPNHYHCSGTPSDCIKYTLASDLFPKRPSLVISGINHGYNLSTDILYSGTLGAASEAAMNGLPTIALSCQRDEMGRYPFRQTAVFACDHLEEFKALCARNCLINVNVPPHCKGQWAPSTMDFLDYHDRMEKVQLENASSMELKILGSAPMQETDSQETDFMRIRHGLIAVSALCVLPSLNFKSQQQLYLLSEVCHV